MRMYGVGDIDGVRPHLDGKRGFRDQLAGIDPDDTAAYDAMCLCVEQHFGDTVVAPKRQGSSRRRPWEDTLANLDALRSGLALGQAGPRDFRIGIGDRRYDARVERAF